LAAGRRVNRGTTPVQPKTKVEALAHGKWSISSVR